MPPSPAELFGALASRCISEGAAKRRTKEALEGACVLLFGIACSVVTAYLMTALGVIV